MSTPRQHVTASGGSGAAPGPHAGSPHDPVPLWNIANILTVGRIALVPVFLVLLFVGDGHDIGWRLAATGVFAIAAITDRIDGQLARKHGLVTDFGKLADPIADKALIGAALVGLSMLGDLSWWVTGIIAARELGITALRFAVLRHAVIPASRGGKLKTLVQTLAIGVYLLPLPESVAPVAIGLMILAVALTVVTGLDYVVQAIRLRTGVRRSESETARAEDVPRVNVLGVDVAGVDVAGEGAAGEGAAAQDTPGDGRTVGEDAR
ncbi:CDP-diacylglycerol--glycerol-3-phosphate 3-phosphatidyltransferase [Rhodococcus pyridinivorans]